jgi:hypothetical protein
MVLSTGPIMILLHGWAGTGSSVTALFIVSSTAVLFASSSRVGFAVDPCDVLFGLFLLTIAASFVANGAAADLKETALLVLSLAAYPACRMFSGKDIGIAFIIVTGAIVGIGAGVTAFYLLLQWDAKHGRPLVFGEFGAAPAEFAASLAFLLFALICRPLSWQRTAAICAGFALPAIIFGASIVRSPFLSMVAALVAGGAAGPRKERKYIAAIISALLLAIAAGQIARSKIALVFLEQGMETLHALARPPVEIAAEQIGRSKTVLGSPGPKVETLRAIEPVEIREGCPPPEKDNPLEIRRRLYVEAIALLPRAGVFGIGLDRFPDLSCIKDTEVHNSLLQVVIEFGWPAGLILATLIWIAVRSAWSSAREDAEAGFVLYGLVFVFTESLAHGQISRDAMLFLFLGYTASLRNQLRKNGPRMMSTGV